MNIYTCNLKQYEILVPVGGDTTGEISQADSGVDVGRPQSQPPDDTQNNHPGTPTRGKIKRNKCKIKQYQATFKLIY